jgi:hypothetical protein
MSPWIWLLLVFVAGATGLHQGKRLGFYYHPAEVKRRRALESMLRQKASRAAVKALLIDDNSV